MKTVENIHSWHYVVSCEAGFASCQIVVCRLQFCENVLCCKCNNTSLSSKPSFQSCNVVFAHTTIWFETISFTKTVCVVCLNVVCAHTTLLRKTKLCIFYVEPKTIVSYLQIQHCNIGLLSQFCWSQCCISQIQQNASGHDGIFQGA